MAIQRGKDNCNDYCIVFCVLQDCMSMHSASCNPRWRNWMDRHWTRKQKGIKNAKKRHRYLVAISWYYLHLPGEMRWLVCSGRHLYPDKRTGTGILSPPLGIRNLPVYISLFRVNVRERTRARAGYCRPSHKARILLQEDSNSAHTAEPLQRAPRRRAAQDGGKERKTIRI